MMRRGVKMAGRLWNQAVTLERVPSTHTKPLAPFTHPWTKQMSSSAAIMEEGAGAGCSLLLDDTAEQFKESVRQFAQENIAPHAAAIDANNTFPQDVNLWKLMGDFNLHGITVPEEFGGLGLGYLYHCIAMEELSRASGSVALSYGAHSNLCINQLVRNGTQAQKEKYLPKVSFLCSLRSNNSWKDK
jgi:alkylation response protein AidB-like acyl-CoA dehydrogenase